MEQHTELAAESPPGENDVLEAILRLPMDYKTVVYLYYYEGYTTGEIAKALHCLQPTVRTRLARARKQLKLMLGGDLE